MDVAEILERAGETGAEQDAAVDGGEESSNSQALANLDQTEEDDGEDGSTGEGGQASEDVETDGEEPEGEDSGEQDGDEGDGTGSGGDGEKTRARAVERKPEANPQETKRKTTAVSEAGTTETKHRSLSADTEAQILKMYHEAGYEGETVEDCVLLKQAEDMGVSVDEFLKKREDEKILAEAKQLLSRQKFERMMESDLKEIREAYPEMDGLKSLAELENRMRFGELRDKGLTAVEAFQLTNQAKLEEARKRKRDAASAAAANAKAKQEGKSHLTGGSATVSAQTQDTVPAYVRNQILSLYPELSEKELRRLYLESKNQ